MANFTVRSQCCRGGSLRARRLECIICFENYTRVVVVLYNISVGSIRSAGICEGLAGGLFFWWFVTYGVGIRLLSTISIGRSSFLGLRIFGKKRYLTRIRVSFLAKDGLSSTSSVIRFAMFFFLFPALV